jgi:hypothetical protein
MVYINKENMHQVLVGMDFCGCGVSPKVPKCDAEEYDWRSFSKPVSRM